MSIYRKDETGVVKKVATPIIQRWNDRIFTTTRSAELVNGVMSTVYDIDPSANKYISGLSNYTEFQLYFGQANNYSTVYVRFNNRMLLLKRSYAASQPIAINTLRYRTTCYTLDTSSNEIWTDYSTDMTLVNNDIIQLKNGTTTVKKAEQDASGNVITTTYETKADATSKLLTKEDKSMKGQPNGYAPLDVSGYIPSAFVPNSFDDVIEFNTYADLLAYGMPQSNKLFVVKQDETSGGNHSTYRWTGTIYIRVTDEMSAAEIKVLYESNADTNSLTDMLKAYLLSAYGHSQTVNSNPHYTTYQQLRNKPTTVEELGVTNVYNKDYIDALKDKNGWESELLGTLSNNGTIALSIINQFDEIQMYAKDTLGVIDNENIRPTLITSGDKIYLFDGTEVYVTFTTTLSFTAPVGYTLQVVGLKYTELVADDVRFNGSVTNYLVDKTEVEGAVKELDTQLKETNARLDNNLQIKSLNTTQIKALDGFIDYTGNIVSGGGYVAVYEVFEGETIRIECDHTSAPVTNAIRWSIFDDETLGAIVDYSEDNSRGKYTEDVHINRHSFIAIQKYYTLSGTVTKLRSDRLYNLEKTTSDISAFSNITSNVFSDYANIDSDDYIKKAYKCIKRIEIFGAEEGRYFISNFSLIEYEGLYLMLEVSRIDDDSITMVCTFSHRLRKSSGIDIIHLSACFDLNIYDAYVEFDIDELGTTLFSNKAPTNATDIERLKKFTISRKCFSQTKVISPLSGQIENRYKAIVKSVHINDLDNTRNYMIKHLTYNRDEGYFYCSICTDENINTAYTFESYIDSQDAKGVVRIGSAPRYIDIDFDILNHEKYITSLFDDNVNIIDYAKYKIDISSSGTPKIIAGDEIALTIDGLPAKLLEYGKTSKRFYIGCGNSIYSVSTIRKNSYAYEDIGKALKLEYTFPDSLDRWYGYNYIEGINSLKELNSGDLIINVCVANYLTVEKENSRKTLSRFYRFNSSDATPIFWGNTSFYSFPDGVVKTGGYWTGVWDFYEYNDLVFITERAPQGVGGRAWMSKDGGITWYVIFNAFTSTPEDYPIVQPSGFDNTDVDHPDFQRPVSGVGDYSNFHIHGISYDHYRDNVIIVSGDATWEKGSYTAIWVLNNPKGCQLYPASGSIPEGTANNVKMLECNWNRIGLYNDENAIGKNLQFVSCIPFKDRLCFGTDNGGGGINGIIRITTPSNIVGSNIRVSYPLNADSENSLTHCASGYLKMNSGIHLWVFHREGSGFNPQTSSDQRGAIMMSHGGVEWNRVWVDDTLDEARTTKITWGATLIGNEEEMYLRYKGSGVQDNVIRPMTLIL